MIAVFLFVSQSIPILLLHERHALVAQQQSSLETEIARMEAPGVTEGDILELNVGGIPMSTTRDTLTQVGVVCFTASCSKPAIPCKKCAAWHYPEMCRFPAPCLLFSLAFVG